MDSGLEAFSRNPTHPTQIQVKEELKEAKGAGKQRRNRGVDVKGMNVTNLQNKG